MILARGARQFVVQDALDTTVILGSYLLLFTPITNIGASAEGADITTFLAPPKRGMRRIENKYFHYVPDR